MLLRKKLNEWQAAGLLDAASAERIRHYEQRSARPLVLYATAGLGAVTIGLGIISVVAANWDGISASAKLCVDLLLAMLLAVVVERAVVRGWALAREVTVSVYYLFTLASLSLVGQIYQLDTPTWVALGSWSLFTVPLMLLGRTHFVAVLWVCGLTTTFAFFLDGAVPSLTSGRIASDLSAVLALGWVVFLLTIAELPVTKRGRPELGRVFRRTAWLLLVGAGMLMPFLFYAPVDATPEFSLLAAVFCALLLVLVVVRFKAWFPALSSRVRLGVGQLLALGWFCFAAGALVPRSSLDVVGASLQLVYLGLVAWTAVSLGWVRAFNAITALIALRVLIVYFEVFGSMLDTGIGMITGGTLTLLLAWLWKQKSPDLAAQLAASPSRGDHAA